MSTTIPKRNLPWRRLTLFGAPPLLLLLGLLTLLPDGEEARAENERPSVVATFSILGNWVEIIGGDRIDVQTLAPIGAEVHEWELTARNFVALEGADIVFANGLNLEQWMGQVEATVQPGTPIIRVADAADHATIPIRIGEFEGRSDPHQWLDPRTARKQVETIALELTAIDPPNADYYAANAARYTDELEALHAELTERLAHIPEQRRTLITSEAAFLYFADAYGFYHDGVWGSNAEDEGTPQQIARIIDVIEERQPAALFWESTISDRYVRSVADDTGTPVAGPLYVDSLGDEGSGAENYIAMMRNNADKLIATLGD